MYKIQKYHVQGCNLIYGSGTRWGARIVQATTHVSTYGMEQQLSEKITQSMYKTERTDERDCYILWYFLLFCFYLLCPLDDHGKSASQAGPSLSRADRVSESEHRIDILLLGPVPVPSRRTAAKDPQRDCTAQAVSVSEAKAESKYDDTVRGEGSTLQPIRKGDEEEERGKEEQGKEAEYGSLSHRSLNIS